MSIRALSVVLMAAVLALPGCAATHSEFEIESPYRDLDTLEKGQIAHLATGRMLNPQQALDYLSRYPVVYVGEAHDNVEDHRVELEILRGLDERHPGQVALGLEMLGRRFQGQVDAYVRGDLDEKSFVREVWSKSWSSRSWPYYRDILRYARKRKVPVVGLNVDEDLKDAVRDKGLEHLEPEMKARLPEIDLGDPYYRAFIDRIFGAHVAGSKYAEVFLRIQVLWDETMAESAAQYLAGGEARRLLIFAGSNHVRFGFGIPRRLFRRLPLPYAIVDPYVVEYAQDERPRMMPVEIPMLPLRNADIAWAVGYETLEGRRARLGVRIADAHGGGAVVKEVVPEGPAAKAGVREGDVVVSVDGEPVGETADLTYHVDLRKPGDTSKLEVLREGERVRVEVVYEAIARPE